MIKQELIRPIFEEVFQNVAGWKNIVRELLVEEREQSPLQAKEIAEVMEVLLDARKFVVIFSADQQEDLASVTNPLAQYMGRYESEYPEHFKGVSELLSKEAREYGESIGMIENLEDTWEPFALGDIIAHIIKRRTGK